jgi:hypothetical protein
LQIELEAVKVTANENVEKKELRPERVWMLLSSR